MEANDEVLQLLDEQLGVLESLEESVGDLRELLGSIGPYQIGTYEVLFWCVTVAAALLVMWLLWRVFREYIF